MASQDRDKPSAGMLRRSLAPPPGSVHDCPGPEILAAYFERTLDNNEIARYELHLSECSRCREQLAAMARADEPGAADGEKRERASGDSWLWGWSRLAPAFAVLMIMAGIWYSQRPARHSLVAMYQPPPMAVAPQESAPETNVLTRIAPAPGAGPARQAAQKVEKPATLTENKTAAADQLNNSNDQVQMNPRAKIPVAAELAAPQTATPRAAGNAGVATSASQSVEVSSAAPLPEAPAARVQTARQMETENGATSPPASGTAVGGAIPGAFSAGAGIAGNKQMSARAVPSRATPQNQAVTLEATDDSSPQKLIRTPNPQILWRIAGGGFVERSTDGGEVWQGQLPNPDAHFIAGAAPTAQTCWLVGQGGIILLTTDGTTWKTIQPPARADFVDVTAKDGSSATVTAADGRKFTTADGGKHWNPAP